MPPRNENLPPTKRRVCMKNKTPEKNMKNAIKKSQNQPKINPTATNDAIPLMPPTLSRQKHKCYPTNATNTIPPTLKNLKDHADKKNQNKPHSHQRRYPTDASNAIPPKTQTLSYQRHKCYPANNSNAIRPPPTTQSPRQL